MICHHNHYHKWQNKLKLTNISRSIMHNIGTVVITYSLYLAQVMPRAILEPRKYASCIQWAAKAPCTALELIIKWVKHLISDHLNSLSWSIDSGILHSNLRLHWFSFKNESPKKLFLKSLFGWENTHFITFWFFSPQTTTQSAIFSPLHSLSCHKHTGLASLFCIMGFWVITQ